MPPDLRTYLERMPLAEGTVLIRQDEPPDDVFVLESGRLSVEMATPEGTRMRLRTVRPGVVVGEIAMYTGVPRTADVVAETPSVVLRLSARVDRADGGRGAGAGRGAAPLARHDAAGTPDRHAAGLRRPASTDRWRDGRVRAATNAGDVRLARRRA